MNDTIEMLTLYRNQAPPRMLLTAKDSRPCIFICVIQELSQLKHHSFCFIRCGRLLPVEGSTILLVLSLYYTILIWHATQHRDSLMLTRPSVLLVQGLLVAHP
jgi:hypothetical protein